MNDNEWSSIPGKLRAEGYSVLFDRLAAGPEHSLWCARAFRGGRQWNAVHKDLSMAVVELGRQTLEAEPGWREMIAHELSETDRLFQHAV